LSNRAVEDTSPSSAAALLDIDAPRRMAAVSVLAWIPILLVCTVAAIYATIVANYIGRFTHIVVGWLVAGATIIAFAAIVWFFHNRRTQLVVRRHLDQSDTTDFRILVPRLLERRGGFDTYAPSLVSGLAARCAFGLTVRSCDKSKRIDIAPIDHPIEPIPLDESAPAFVALRETSPGDGQEDGASPVEAPSAATDVERSLKRNWRFGGGWLSLVLLLALSAMIVYDVLLFKRTSWYLVAIVLWNACAMFGLGGRGAWTSFNQWVLVPGGLVVRQPKRRSHQQWNVRLFGRSTSVLLVRQNSRDVWQVWVADGEKEHTAYTTGAEAEMLLRFWLSPLTPPSAEQLSDLE